MTDLEELDRTLASLQGRVERHISRARVRRYLSALVDVPAPSTFAAPMRLPVLRRLLAEDRAFTTPLHLHADFCRTGSPVILTGANEVAKPLWYFAHLDTISYLVQPFDGARYPLVPFCVHLIRDGVRPAQAHRFDLARNALVRIAEGRLESDDGAASFRPVDGAPPLRPGDRVTLSSCYWEDAETGQFNGSMDNAGGGRRAGARGARAGRGRDRGHAGLPGRGGRPRGTRQSHDRSWQQPHRVPAARSGPRHRRGCPAGWWRPGCRYARRHREFRAARRRRRACGVLERGPGRRHTARPLRHRAPHRRPARGPRGLGAGIQQCLLVAQRRRERHAEDPEHPATGLSRLQSPLRPWSAPRPPRRRGPPRQGAGSTWRPSVR